MNETTSVTVPIAPKFILNRLGDTVFIALNVVMARDLHALLDEFNDLKPHEYALRCKLENVLPVEQEAA